MHADVVPADGGPKPPSEPPYVAVNDREALPALIALADSAKTTLDVVHFEWVGGQSVDAFRTALVNATRRGVAVRVLLEAEVDANAGSAADLQALGIAARLQSTTALMHIKLAVADGARALVGSTNLSWASLERNHETNVRVADNTCAPALAALADSMLTAGHPPHGPPADPTAPCVPYLPAGALEPTLAAIAEANTHIDVVLYAFALSEGYTDGPPFELLEALAAARARGVAVRVVLEDGTSYAPVAEHNVRAAALLQARGIDVRFDGPAQVTHAKLLVADDQVVVGSANWSYSGLARNYEAGLRVRDEALAATFGQYADALWQAGVAVPPGPAGE